MSYSTIIVETRGKVGMIRLNRPQALNALNSQLIGELGQAIAAFDADPEIGCMLMTGSEKAFAAGADIKEMVDKTFVDALNGDFTASWDHIARARKPIVAAVAGFALGGGCELVMQCDIVIAADDAKFGQPEIELATIPGLGGTQRLARAIGKAKAMDLILTGRMMDAHEAERSGLVARVVPAAKLFDDAMAVADSHRQHVATVGLSCEGSRQSQLRDDADGRASLRTACVPRTVCDRGPEGRYDRLRRETAGSFKNR